MWGVWEIDRRNGAGAWRYYQRDCGWAESQIRRYDQRLEVFGSKGMLQGNNIFKDNHSFYNEKGVESSLPMNFFLERYAEAYIFEIKSFIGSLINNSSVSVNGKDGLESLRIGLAAKKSLLENRPVKLNEIET